MGKHDGKSQMYGIISDVNVWDRVLRPTEIINWSDCSTQLFGNVISWINIQSGILFTFVHIYIYNLFIFFVDFNQTLYASEIDHNEVCSFKVSFMKYDIMMGNKMFYIVLDSVDLYYQFCSILGGKVAVTDDIVKINEMKNLSASSMRPGFFTGFCGSEENEWTDINEDLPLPEDISVMIQDYGSVHSNGKCLYYENDVIYPVGISTGIIPICEVKPNVFVLR